MRSLIRISQFVVYSHSLILPLSPTSRTHFKICYSAAPQRDLSHQHKECDEFLRWLRQKAGREISSVLTIGFSSIGRSLFASKPFQAGDCILKVPYSAQISTDKIRPEIECLLVDGIDSISRLAVVLLAEKKLGQDSEWAPYIQSLPRINEMHNMMFWSKEELDMLQASSIYQDIIDQKSHVEQEFWALKPALDQFPRFFGDFVLEDFMHAYALIISRAWRTSRGISLIPFADFLNHDGASESDLLNDDIKELSEVIADRSYNAGEQVLIRYGKFPNSTLMLDFGFTLQYNIHDQVQIWMEIPMHDPLYALKLELLDKHSFPTNQDDNAPNSSRSRFTIREVKSPNGKGKGIPQALRAYARILSITSHEDLKALGVEADENDGRLARCPLKDMEYEIKAHHILLSQLTRMIQDHDAADKVLESMTTSGISSQFAIRKSMAMNLLTGEVRVLQSACAWLANYCANVSVSSEKERSEN